MIVLAQSKKNFIKQYDNGTTLVFLWDKTTPITYKIRGTWPRVSIYPIVKQINLLSLLQHFYPLLQLPYYSSFDPMTKDGVLGLPTDLGQPGDVLALTGPSRVKALTVSLLVCLKTSRFFITQAR